MKAKARWWSGIHPTVSGDKEQGGVRPGKGHAGTGRELCTITERESSSESPEADSLDMHELYVGRLDENIHS